MWINLHDQQRHKAVYALSWNCIIIQQLLNHIYKNACSFAVLRAIQSGHFSRNFFFIFFYSTWISFHFKI